MHDSQFSSLTHDFDGDDDDDDDDDDAADNYDDVEEHSRRKRTVTIRHILSFTIWNDFKMASFYNFYVFHSEFCSILFAAFCHS